MTEPNQEAVEQMEPSKLSIIAKRNLHYYLGNAPFKSENDREAALNCLTVLEDEISQQADLIAVLRSYQAAEEQVANHRRTAGAQSTSGEVDLVERVARAIDPGLWKFLDDPAWFMADNPEDVAKRDASLERAQRAIASMPDESKLIDWQPIQTAPMDGTPLLLFARAEQATASAQVIGWHLPDEGWIALTFAPNVPTKLVPSHWRNLPGFPRHG